MDASEDNRARIATVSAAAMLLLHLPTPRNDYSLMTGMINVLEGALYDRDLVCNALDAIVLLATGKPRLVTDHFTLLAKAMLNILGDSDSNEKMRQLSLDFFVKEPEGGNNSYVMIQNLPENLIEELFTQLLQLLMCIEDDISWKETDDCDMDAGKTNLYRHAVNALRKLATVLGEDAILSNPPKLFTYFFADLDWKKRHAAVTALRLITPFFNSSLILVENLKHSLIKTTELIRDQHPRVRWAAIYAISEFSKYLSPYFQAECHKEVIPALSEGMDDFGNPRVQTYAASAMSNFCQNCSSDTLKLCLEEMISKLVMFLQTGQTFLQETALSELASLADSTQEDFQPFYSTVMPCLKLILHENSNSMLVAKTLECITVVAVAVGKSVFSTDVAEIVNTLLSEHNLVDTNYQVECHLVQAWGRICISLGEDFHPYMNEVMPLLIKSAKLEDDPMEWDFEKTRIVSEKILGACNAIINSKGGLHLWIEEVLKVVGPLFTFGFNEEVTVAAISIMPLLLQSTVTAVENDELPIPEFLDSPIIALAKIIIPALVRALEVPTIKIQEQALVALKESMQIASTWAPDKEEILGRILMVLSEFFDWKGERENLEKYSLDLVKEEIHEHNICREVRICLQILLKRMCAQNIIPEIVYVKRMWQKDRTPEERRMAFDIFRYIAVEFGEQGLRQYTDCITFLFEVCRDTDPNIQQIAARAIGIYAEFDGETFKQHLQDGLSSLEFILEHPDEHRAKDAAICAYGKLCFFLCGEEINSYENIDRWLVHLPIKHWNDEAKAAHKLLCSMVDKLNTRIHDDDYITRIIRIIVKVLWMGKHIAEEETLQKMIQQLKMFKKQLAAKKFTRIQETLPGKFLRDTLQRHT